MVIGFLMFSSNTLTDTIKCRAIKLKFVSNIDVYKWSFAGVKSSSLYLINPSKVTLQPLSHVVFENLNSMRYTSIYLLHIFQKSYLIQVLVKAYKHK